MYYIELAAARQQRPLSEFLRKSLEEKIREAGGYNKGEKTAKAS